MRELRLKLKDIYIDSVEVKYSKLQLTTSPEGKYTPQEGEMISGRLLPVITEIESIKISGVNVVLVNQGLPAFRVSSKDRIFVFADKSGVYFDVSYFDRVVRRNEEIKLKHSGIALTKEDDYATVQDMGMVLYSGQYYDENRKQYYYRLSNDQYTTNIYVRSIGGKSEFNLKGKKIYIKDVKFIKV